MNRSLAELALSLALDAPEQSRLRLAFGLACAERVRHFLTDPQAAAALDALAEHLSGKATEQSLANQAALVAALARSHPGSGPSHSNDMHSLKIFRKVVNLQ